MSLGDFCRTKYQINNCLYTTADRAPVSLYFDWLETSLKGLYELLKTDFRESFNIENFKRNEKGHAYDFKNKISYPHAFTKSHEEILQSEFNEQAKKFKYLSDKTLNFIENENYPLFIRSGANHTAVDELVRILADLRRGEFHLLWVIFDDTRKGVVDTSGLHTVYSIPSRVTKVKEDAWQGNDIYWLEMFKDLSFRLS